MPEFPYDHAEPTEPIHQELAEEFHVTPKVIAFIRSAFMDGNYDRQSLTYFIIEDGIEKKKEIQQLKYTITEQNVDTIKEKILQIQKILDLRQSVLTLLRNLEDHHIRRLTKPV